MTEPRLFDPKTTQAVRCPSCGTTSKNLCAWDADASESAPTSPRPRGCLNSATQLGPDDELPYA